MFRMKSIGIRLFIGVAILLCTQDAMAAQNDVQTQAQELQVQWLYDQMHQEWCRVRNLITEARGQGPLSAQRVLRLRLLIEQLEHGGDVVRDTQKRLSFTKRQHLWKLVCAIIRGDFYGVMDALFHQQTALNYNDQDMNKAAIWIACHLISIDDAFEMIVNLKLRIINLLLIKQMQIQENQEAETDISGFVCEIGTWVNNIARIRTLDEARVIVAINTQLHTGLSETAQLVEQTYGFLPGEFLCMDLLTAYKSDPLEPKDTRNVLPKVRMVVS